MGMWIGFMVIALCNVVVGYYFGGPCCPHLQISPEFHTFFSIMLPRTQWELTPWSRAILEKLIVIQLVKKFLTFHGTQKFITIKFFMSFIYYNSLYLCVPLRSFSYCC